MSVRTSLRRAGRVLAATISFGVLGAGVIATAVAVAGPATAHAELTGSNPSRGATVDAIPRSVTLSFSEAVSRPAAISVVGPDRTDLAVGEPRVVDNTIAVSTDAAAAPGGQYTIGYQVVSDDGHPVSGTVQFVLKGATGRQPAPAAPAAPASDPGVSRGLVVGLLAALVLSLGTVVVGLSRLVGGERRG